MAINSDESPKAIKSDSVARLAFKTATVLISVFSFSIFVSFFCFFPDDSLQETKNKIIDIKSPKECLSYLIRKKESSDH